LIALASETAPIAAVKTAPPMMLITRKEDAAFVSGPRFRKELAKMVGNMMDMNRLVAVSA
jgi:hypothetical protein